MHFTGDRAAAGARHAVGGNELGVGLQLVDVFRDRERVPDLQAIMGQPWHQKGRRQQQQFRPRGGVIRADMVLFKLDTSHFAEQPSAQRP